MSAVRTAPEPVRRGGITVRPPRVLVANRQHPSALDEPVDAARVRQLERDGVLDRPPEPSAVVYQVTAGQHRQTGVLVEVSVGDYRDGRIRRHEGTQPERVRRLDEFTEANGTEQVPVTLTHPARAGLRALLAEITAGEPDVRLPTGEGLTHSVWIRPEPLVAQAIQDELDDVETLYVADGHHRMAAAERYAGRRGQPGTFTLAALFPSDEMRILGYPRCVPRPVGVSTPRLLGTLAGLPAVARIEEFAPPESIRPARGEISMYLDNRWYRLWLRRPRGNGRAGLDVVTLDEDIIASVFGVTDAGHTPLPGASDAAAIAGWCAEHDGVGLLARPPDVEQVMAVSDAGEVMPPKSTWFDPKASSELFVREIG
ncbi:MAG: DUF1015 family protein [Pseudonocardiaceae bacterium]|nr:DUF1015 family protein [Pseudonocardiaceae bacterium]